jgi:hypothetical protein
MYASNEIVSTEQRYFQQLSMMENMYKIPLEEHGVETTKIFGNLSSLIKLHRTILDEMERVHKDWDPKTSDYSVAKVLKDFSIPFKLYVEYINSYDNALKNLQLLEEDDKTRNLIEKLGGFSFIIYIYILFFIFYCLFLFLFFTETDLLVFWDLGDYFVLYLFLFIDFNFFCF